MLFPTLQFLGFFLVIFGIGAFLKKYVELYKYYIFAVSIIFYSFWSFTFLGLLLLNIIINYLFICKIFKRQKSRKTFLIIGIIVNLLYLGVFKYYNFFIDSLYQLLHTLNIQASLSVIEILVPIGISFYTFRVISHLVDVYKKELQRPSFIEFAAYVSFFPQIAAGPITRAKEFYADLRQESGFKYKYVVVITLILSGLFKKYALSSFLYNFTQGPFSTPENYSSPDLIIAMLAYTAMIYVDFSGYSDLAIAISNLLGFNAPQNFDMPYKSLSLKEFWRRWHMSLSSWLRDYLYFPLGGNRKGELRKYFNLFLTMFLGGIWHAVSIVVYPYMIWGAMHGIGLAFNHFFEKATEGFRSKITDPILIYIGTIISWLITFTFVSFAWVFFNSRSVESGWKFITGIFSSGVSDVKYLQFHVLAVIGIVLLMNFFGKQISDWFQRILKTGFIIRVLIITIVLYIILRLGPEQVAPFIYFSF